MSELDRLAPELARFDGSPPTRVGRIEFVNCFPLYEHFEEEITWRGQRADIISGDPSTLNRMLIAGELDIALPSSIEFARHAEQLELLTGVTISSLGAVDSIQLFSKVPRERIETIALTPSSATSIALLRVLCRAWSVMPTFDAYDGHLHNALASNDALLLIGDEALKVLRADVYPYHYDLGAEWLTLTGLPMVYAVSAARKTFAAERPAAVAAVEAALVASRDRCAANPEETAAAAARHYDFDEKYLLHYFDQLKFGFAEEYRRGLTEFWRRAIAVGELDRVPMLTTTSAPAAPAPADPAAASTPASAPLSSDPLAVLDALDVPLTKPAPFAPPTRPDPSAPESPSSS